MNIQTLNKQAWPSSEPPRYHQSYPVSNFSWHLAGQSTNDDADYDDVVAATDDDNADGGDAAAAEDDDGDDGDDDEDDDDEDDDNTSHCVSWLLSDNAQENRGQDTQADNISER